MHYRLSYKLFKNVPIYHSRLEEIDDALLENVISKYYMLGNIIMNQDSMFMSPLMNYLFQKLNIKINTVAPYNHQSLQNRTWHKIIVHDIN